MGRSVRIGIIGAGSASFSLNVVRDLCLTHGLAGSQVCFMDIDHERLNAVSRLAQRYAHELGVDLRFEHSTERTAALRDADFVLNTAARSHQDEETERAIWEEHGYYRGVRVPYHNLAMMLSVAHDIERLCPRAWLLQSSNPVFEGCTLMTRETPVKVIGLCHGHAAYTEIAEILGLDAADVTCEAIGVNHCIWMRSFRYQGENAYPLLDRWIAHEAERYWATHEPTYGESQLSRTAVDLYRMIGLFPIGDTVRFGGSQYISSWWYHSDVASKCAWYGALGGFDSERGWSQYLRALERNLARLMHVAYDDALPVTHELPPTHSGEQIVPVIDAIANDRQGLFQVNVPNKGALPGIPDDVVVEIPAAVSGSGVHPLRLEVLPRPVLTRALIPKILEMEMNLEVFQTGNPRAWLHHLLFDHRTTSPRQAINALEAILDLPFNAALHARFGNIGRTLGHPYEGDSVT